MLGRDFAPSDETPGAAPVAILRYGFWERRYGKDPGIIGRARPDQRHADDRHRRHAARLFLPAE